MTDYVSDISACVQTLQQGGVIVYPTDTVWGIGCNALDAQAVDKVFALKQRPKHKSLILLLADAAALAHYTAKFDPAIVARIRAFDEPTTVIFQQACNLPANVINEDGSVAIRLTRDPFCRSLIAATGGKPLVSTSANVSGGPTAALYPEIDPIILNGADYVAHYRRDDLQRAAPSRIVRFGEDGVLEYLR